jgi:hypothetical protein
MRIVSQSRSDNSTLAVRRRRRRSRHLAALDQFLNARVLSAANDAALDAAMRLKTSVKRRLVVLPDEAIERAARAALQELAHGE